MKRILAINLGSTSTKMAYYEDEQCVCRGTADHTSEEIQQYERMLDQIDLRKIAILRFMVANDIRMERLDAFVSKGGHIEPIAGGTYRISRTLLALIENEEFGVHAHSLGCRIAFDFTNGGKGVPLSVETTTSGEQEMDSLCLDAYEALCGRSDIKQYFP